MLQITCAWCPKPMGEKPGLGVTGTTDGICAPCLERETRAVLATMQLHREIEAMKEKDA